MSSNPTTSEQRDPGDTPPEADAVANSGGLSRSLKPRQLTMMALGSAIGTGLFIGSGSAIHVAGPAAIISYLIAGTIVILVMRALGEMAAAHPNSGAFSHFAQLAMGRVAGATVGWLWWIQIVVVIAAEATGAAGVVNAVFPAIPLWASTLVFMVAFTAINLLGVSRFGELEFWFAVLKVVIILAFLVVGILVIIGVIPTASGPGFGNWVSHGGFLPQGVQGIAAGLLVVTFAFGGTELVTIAAAETKDPQRSVSQAIRSVVWRILVFYIATTAVMISVLPWDSAGTKEPFAAVLAQAHIPYAGEVTNLAIAVALLSALNANLYGGSRMIFSLAQRGMAPRFISRVTRKGVPAVAVLASVFFGFVTVILNFIDPEHTLNFLLQLVGSTVLVIWVLTIVSQLVLRKRANDRGEQMAVKMWWFPYASIVALVLIALVFVLGFIDPAVRIQLISTIVLTLVIALLNWIAVSLSRKKQTSLTE